jgi:hypothetical protein
MKGGNLEKKSVGRLMMICFAAAARVETWFAVDQAPLALTFVLSYS